MDSSLPEDQDQPGDEYSDAGSQRLIADSDYRVGHRQDNAEDYLDDGEGVRKDLRCSDLRLFSQVTTEQALSALRPNFALLFRPCHLEHT